MHLSISIVLNHTFFAWIANLSILYLFYSRTKAENQAGQPIIILNQTVTEDTPSVTLQCGVALAKPILTSIHWLFNHTVVLSQKDSDKFSGGNTTYTSLIINNISRTDSGNYHCQITNEEITLEGNEYFLQVKYVPSSYIISSLPTTINEGQDLTLECKISDGLPMTFDDVKWYKDGAEIKQSAHITIENQTHLVLSNVTSNDSGTYQCNMNNEVAFGKKSQSFDLKITYTSKCKFGGRSAYALHTSFNLLCEVDSTESTNISFTWKHNSSLPIQNEEGLTINTNGSQSILSIAFAEDYNYGDYYCHPAVDGVQIEPPCIYAIQTPGKPETPKDCKIEEAEQTTLFLHCTEGFNGGYPQGFVVDIYLQDKLMKIVNTPKLDYEIKDLKPQRNYTLKVFANNKIGTSEPVVLNAQTTEKDNLTPLVAGIVSGVLVGVLFVTGVIAMSILYHKKKSRQQTMHRKHRKTSSNTSQEEISEDQEKLYQFQQSSVEIQEKIGEGIFSQVYKAVVRDPEKGIKELKFALREPKDCTGSDRREVEREVIVLRSVPPHSSIMHLFGYIQKPDYFAALLEWFPKGNLKNSLLETKNHLQELFESKGNFEGAADILVVKDLLFYAHQISSAMAHISRYKCLHRDLACRNIFIASNKICKIADFGLAKDIATTRQNDQNNKNPIPVRWMALESLTKQEYKIKSDVWSFGILCWEILHLGATPYPDKSGKETIKAIKNGFRLKKPAHCSSDLYSLIEMCWNASIQERPNFERLAAELYHYSVRGGNHILLSDLNEDILSHPDIQLDMNEKY